MDLNQLLSYKFLKMMHSILWVTIIQLPLLMQCMFRALEIDFFHLRKIHAVSVKFQVQKYIHNNDGIMT